MSDLEKRLRRTFSSMAAYESLEDALDEKTATAMVKWGDVFARQFVLRSSQMDDDVADEYLAPYASALRKMMRAIGHCAVEKDQTARLEWWNRIEQNAKTLFGDRFMLPRMEIWLSQLSAGSDAQSMIASIQKLIETQKAKG